MKTTLFQNLPMAEKSEGLITPLPGQSFFNLLLKSISEAKYKIDIMQYQWNFYRNKPDDWVQQFNQLLLIKIQNGVKCRVLLNKEGRGQNLMAINQNASDYLTQAGASVKFGKSVPINHSKLFLIDDRLTICGSHNISSRAFKLNNEVSLLVDSVAVNVELTRYFNSIWCLQ
jgi:phosphatidylserine/phosphatidylglycerophosphate/cardiolipin synthase-like enzyme